MVVMVNMVITVEIAIRTDRTTKVTGQTRQTSQRGQTDLTFKLDIPGNLCRAAFAILAMIILFGYSPNLSLNLMIHLVFWFTKIDDPRN